MLNLELFALLLHIVAAVAAVSALSAQAALAHTDDLLGPLDCPAASPERHRMLEEAERNAERWQDYQRRRETLLRSRL